jgi:hypothetical protein
MKRYPMKFQSGYILLSLMFIIGLIGIYLAAKLSVQNTKITAWEIQKSTTEMEYWFDIEQNYALDNGSNSLSTITLPALQTYYYLPYGSAEKNTFNLSTNVSQFICSALPGITPQDGNLNLSGSSVTTTCPGAACALNNTYYSCGNNLPKAQYYVNTNYIALQPPSVGLGLMIRTPKMATQQTSTANHLMALLPTSSSNTYTTSASQEVNGIGIGTYAIPPSGTTYIANNTYSKIIDMGLVQAKNLNNTDSLNCYGWDNNGNKSGSGGLNGKKRDKYPDEPPTCIRVNLTKYQASCNSIDLFYSLYRAHVNADTGNSGFVGFSIEKSYVKPYSANGKTFKDIYLGTNIYDRGSKSGYQISQDDARRNYLIYFVRCTRNFS